MKKLLVTLLIAFLAISTVFAADNPGKATGDGAIKGEGSNQGATLKVTANFPAASLAGYRMGFAATTNAEASAWKENHNLATLPAGNGVTEVDISGGLKTDTAVATDTTMSLYCKIKSVQTVVIKLSGEQLSGQDEDNSGKKINYTVAVTGGQDPNGNDVDTSTGDFWTDTIDMTTEHFYAQHYPLTITTQELTADLTGNYAGTLTLTVSAS